MSIDIYAVLEKFKAREAGMMRPQLNVIEDITQHLREAEKSDYLGTLYRTDFEVEGRGAFPVDMLRYTSSWPKGESDARAIEDSFDSSVRHTVCLSKYHRDPEANLAGDRWEAKFRWRVMRVIETVAV